MKKSSRGLIVVLVVIVLAVVLASTAFGSYNSLVSLREDVQSGQADIQTQLQRRADLIPNLVNTVKGYAAHEEEVFSQIADARAKLAGGGTMPELAGANDELSGALSRLLSITESYPELKSDAQYTALMDELAGTENRITISRKNYNEQVRAYNGAIQRFPTMLAAALFGFRPADYFEASGGAQTPPVVDFGS